MGSHALKNQFPARRPTAVVEEPVRALIVPKQGVSIHRQAVGMGHIYQSVRLGKTEATLSRLQRHRLHAVLGRHGIEVCKQEPALRRIELGAGDCGPNREAVEKTLHVSVLFPILRCGDRREFDQIVSFACGLHGLVLAGRVLHDIVRGELLGHGGILRSRRNGCREEGEDCYGQE